MISVHDFQHSGRIFFQGLDIYGKQIEVSWLRRRMGMVTSTPTVLPYSIFDNIAFALRLEGLSDFGQVHLTVQELSAAGGPVGSGGTSIGRSSPAFNQRAATTVVSGESAGLVPGGLVVG